MADIITKTLNTRIKLKYDLYSTWATKNPVLLEGEVALAYIPTDSSISEGNVSVSGTTPPQVLIKVGDGTNHYNDLKYVSALAADVVTACKSEAGLTTFIQSVIDGANMADNDEFKALSDRVATLEGTGDGSVAKAITDAIAALDLANTYAEKEHAHTKDEITDFDHTHTKSEITDFAHTHTVSEITDFDTSVKAYDYATKVDAQGYADAKDEVIAAAQQAGDDAQADVDALAAKVGEVPTDKTVVQMITDAQTAATYDDTALVGRVKAIEDDYLVEADKTALQDQITANTNAIELLTNGVSAEEVDGVNDLIQYVKDHGTEVTGIKADIAANTKAIDDHKALAAETYETKGDATTKLGEAKTYADSLNTAMDTRVKSLEDAKKTYGDIVTHNANEFALATALDNYYTKEQADAEFTNATEVDGQIDTKISDLGLGTMSKETATDYVKKSEATGYDDILTKTEAASTYQAKGEYATAEQGSKADTAIQTVTADTGLTATKTGTDVIIAIDDTVTFIFDCGTSAV